MKASDFSKLMKQDKLDSFYIFTGSERCRMTKCIKALKYEKVVKVSSLETLIKLYSSNDIFGGKKLLVYEGEDLCEQTLTSLQRKSQNMAIVLMKTVDKRKKIFKGLKNVIEFDKPSEGTLFRVVDDILGVELEESIVSTIISRCNADLGRVENECNKLRVHLDLGNTITKELIDDNITPNTEDVAFELVNAIVRRDKSRAIHLIQKLYITKESPVVILLLLYRQFRNIVIIQGYKNDAPKDIAMKTGLNVNMIYAIRNNIGKFTMSELVKILDILNSTDVRIKRGAMDMYIGLELAVMRILDM